MAVKRACAVVVVIGCYISAEVFEEGGARAEMRFVEALAKGCGFFVVQLVLVDWMAD